MLGDLAQRDVLVDIEEPTTNVEGVINIDGREILIEATNTSQRLIPDTGLGVFFGDPSVEIDQVVNKVRKKVADGRQFASAAGKPTVLFLARRERGTTGGGVTCNRSSGFGANWRCRRLMEMHRRVLTDRRDRQLQTLARPTGSCAERHMAGQAERT